MSRGSTDQCWSWNRRRSWEVRDFKYWLSNNWGLLVSVIATVPLSVPDHHEEWELHDSSQYSRGPGNLLFSRISHLFYDMNTSAYLNPDVLTIGVKVKVHILLHSCKQLCSKNISTREWDICNRKNIIAESSETKSEPVELKLLKIYPGARKVNDFREFFWG